MGIAIDILVVLFLVWSVLRGWKLGLLYQVAYLALMVVAYFVSRMLAGVLDRPVARLLGAAQIVGGTVTFFALLLVLLFIGAILVRKMTKDLVPDDSLLSPPNRALGAVVSGAKGALIAFVVLVFLLQFQAITRKIDLPVQSSFALRFVSEHNFLANSSLGAFTKLAWLAAKKDPRLANLMKLDKAKALMTPEVMRALGDYDYVTLVQNPAFQDFLADPAVRAELEAIPW